MKMEKVFVHFAMILEHFVYDFFIPNAPIYCFKGSRSLRAPKVLLLLGQEPRNLLLCITRGSQPPLKSEKEGLAVCEPSLSTSFDPCFQNVDLKAGTSEMVLDAREGFAQKLLSQI